MWLNALETGATFAFGARVFFRIATAFFFISVNEIKCTEDDEKMYKYIVVYIVNTCEHNKV